MKIKFALFAVLSFLCLFVTPIVAQMVDTTGVSDFTLVESEGVAGMLNAYNVLYGALVIAWGYIAKLIGIETKPNRFVFIILAGGVVLAGAFMAFGVSSAFPLVFSFLGSIGIYDLFLKPTGLRIRNNNSKIVTKGEY